MPGGLCFENLNFAPESSLGDGAVMLWSTVY
jgi:hypothetical protein